MSITNELMEWASSELSYKTRIDELIAIADRIDAEHERQLEVLYRDMSDAEYIKLPKDANGEYIQPSDIPYLTKTNDGERLAFCPSLELRQDGTWRLAGWETDRYRISKPTVEDVLREFAMEVCGEPALTIRSGVVEEYASRLRLAGEN